MILSPAQSFALSDIAARARDLSDWTATIFAFGETAWREYRSAAWYVERLRAEGFEAPHIDYTDAASIDAGLAEVLAATGGTLDALFNNGAHQLNAEV